MIKVAIVEDDNDAKNLLIQYLEKYGNNENEIFNISTFFDPIGILDNYKPTYDIIFLDIMMPNMNGMEAAFKIREIDNSVTLIFVTNMKEYASKGYDVQAFAFLNKPITYDDFQDKIKRAISSLKTREKEFIIISSGQSKIRRPLRDLIYIEVSGHNCKYHFTDTVIEGRNSLKDLAKDLEPHSFMMCNSCYLINPYYIKNISGLTLQIGNDTLEISHSKKKKFMEDFAKWLANTMKV